MTNRCQALDSSGRRCPSQKTKLYSYHGAEELYDYITDMRHRERKQSGWVCAYFCELHKGNILFKAKRLNDE